MNGGLMKNERRLNLFPKVKTVVEDIFLPIGFEAHPFHIGWYNDLVDPKFQLDYSYHTVALVVLNGPNIFETCVIPYIRTQLNKTSNFTTFDPLDESMKCIFRAVKQKLEITGFDVDLFHDFELHPNRRPKVLVQTAAHVAGAVEYFHRDRLKTLINTQTWAKHSKLFGVAIHPEHGGWFAIRGVIVLKNLLLDENTAIPRPGVTIQVNDENKIAILLEQFALNWKNHAWRDILPRLGQSKYSQDFISYLDTEPEKRWEFLKNNNFIPS